MVYDCIVIGFGGVGSNALRFAAMNGWKVLGLDRYGPAHDRGSSHGRTRMIRHAYFEHPSYVPLCHRAFEMWDELNKRHRTKPEIKELITPIGLLQIGNPESEVIQGVTRSAAEHQLKLERFTPNQIRQRLPIFKVDENHVGLFEPDAAFLRVELCVAAAVKQAVHHGAEIKSDIVVKNWQINGDGELTVDTEQGSFRTKRLIVAAGAWTSQLLPDVELGLKVIQKQQHWFQLDRVDQKIENNFPCFLIEQDDGDCFYGIPEIDYLGMKVCEHSGGHPLESPADLNRGLNEAALKRTEEFMRRSLEFGRSRLVHHSNCMYTMSQDGHFLVDTHPGHDNVVFAAGLSGHGFKFAPVIGKHLVELLDGKHDSDFDLFKLSRFASRSPTSIAKNDRECQN